MTWAEIRALYPDNPKAQAAITAYFNDQVEQQTDRWMGLAPTLGELHAAHMGKVLTFTVGTASGEPSEVVGVLFDISHEIRRDQRRTTVQVRTEERFETFTLPSEHRCKLEDYEESVRTAQ